ncbi:hypothetical protein [Thalassotalea ganghwensis]
MKYITILGLIIIGVFFYENEAFSGAQVNVKTYGDVFTKLKYSPVTIDEIRIGSTDFAKKLCKDESFQQAAGESPSSCLLKLESFESACADKIFGDAEKLYSDKTSVTLLSERYISCLSA